MSYDHSKLMGRVVEKLGTQREFSKRMGLSERSISLKINGKIQWKQSEIARACEVLDIEDRDIQSYFFTPKVQ